MKIEFIIFIITALLIANTYYDGKLVKLFNMIKHSKYLKMITFGFAGLSIYLFLKKNPNNSKEFLGQANEMIKTLPMTRDSASLITPFLNLTNSKSFNDTNSSIWGGGGGGGGSGSGDGGGSGDRDGGNTFQSQINRMMQSGKGSTKRSVSETKKKFIAANQNWICKDCNKQLPAWFEVDHVIALHNGGTNEIDNLVALCRDCHGKKTAMDRLNH
jgi:hypothetical protein